MSRQRIHAGRNIEPTPHLISPLTVGNLTLKNRLVVVPMESARATTDGFATDALLDRLSTLAQSGRVALVETSHHYVSPEGQATARQTSATTDKTLDSLAREAEAIHKAGSLAFAQLSHAGSAASHAICGRDPIAPSATLCPGAKVGHPLPRPMTTRDIARVTEDFALAAHRAHTAGFDGIELHAAHGYLLDQFLSPLTNQRSDAYGPQSIESRTRFLLDVIAAVRQAVGRDFALSVRLGACDYLPGGTTIDDGVQMARLLEAASVDLISISGGMCYYRRIDTEEPGWFADASTAVRQAVSIPVLLAGGIRRSAEAEALLAQGACDLAGVGRSIANNPRWAELELKGNAPYGAQNKVL